MGVLGVPGRWREAEAQLLLAWGPQLPPWDGNLAGLGSRSPEGEAVSASEPAAGSCWAFTKLASTRAASSLLGAILRRKAV